MIDIVPFIGFAIATDITPGPNNLLLTITGVKYGYLRSLPLLSGIIVGFYVLLLTNASILGWIFASIPYVHEVIRYAGCAYLLYLAWRIATDEHDEDVETTRHYGFWHGFTLQFLNPKSWVMVIAAVGAFINTDSKFFLASCLLGIIYSITYVFCGSIWVLFGMTLERFLKNPKAYRTFNVLMGILLATTAIALLA